MRRNIVRRWAGVAGTGRWRSATIAALCAWLGLGFGAGPAHAQAHGGHDAGAGGLVVAGQPLSTPIHGLRLTAGAWSMLLHGRVAAIGTDVGGPRGSEAVFSTSHFALRASRAFAGGELQLRGIATLEPLMGARGYPLLLQTGETADGQYPLVDRQHPHDAIMELAASWQRPLDSELTLTAYLGAVGAPAIGPPAFMHRASGMEIPTAPLGHHFMDATHITHGVATIGLVSQRRLHIELSAFNGLEPDQKRWAPERPRFDSYAARASVRAGPDITLQASMGRLRSPERMHPGVDQVRLTASLIWNRPLAGGNWQTTVAVGRNKNERTLIPVPEARRTFPEAVLNHYISLADSSGIDTDSLTLLFPTRVQTALLLESTLAHGRSSFLVRLERVQKDELFPPTDARHSRVYTIAKVDAGYIFDVVDSGRGRIGLGILVSAHALPAELHAAYGSRPTSLLAFTRIGL